MTCGLISHRSIVLVVDNIDFHNVFVRFAGLLVVRIVRVIIGAALQAHRTTNNILVLLVFLLSLNVSSIRRSLVLCCLWLAL